MTADRVTNRRILLCVIAGGLIAAWLNVGAQRMEKVARIGWLCPVRCEGAAYDALRAGLRSDGWVEGSNLQIEYRVAGGQLDRLPALAQELVDLKPDLIVVGSPQPSRAVKNANDQRALSAGRATRGAAVGVQLQVLEARAPDEIERAIDTAVQGKADALWVIGDRNFNNPAQRNPDLAARARLPSMYLIGEQVVAGGLLSYGPDFIEMNHRGAVYIDKILKGAKPADLSVEQPTKFRLVINLKTAKALGITIPQSVVLRADEVIQ